MDVVTDAAPPAAAAAAAGDAAAVAAGAPAHRLPAGPVPVRYDVRLRVDNVACTFSGTCDATVTLPRTQRDAATGNLTLALHAMNLALATPPTLALVGVAAAALPAVEVALVSGASTLTAVFAVPAAAWDAAPRDGAGAVTAVLHTAFSAPLGDTLAGLYRSPYRTAAGAAAWVAATQMQATDARRCFPCWDEPAAKAVFALTVDTLAHNTVISNTLPASVVTAPGGAWKTWTFAPTPKMSTYLVGLFIGEFDVVTGVTAAGVVTSVYTPPGKGAQGAFALDTAVRCLNFFAARFDTPYALPKCDLVALDELGPAAMENWGAISFRSNYLLVDDAATPMLTRQRIAQVVCHELSHQWFGNLTTPEWWSWLGNNESWAQFMEYLATDALFPEWNVFGSFNATIAVAGFSKAALASAHPIQVDVADPAEIDEIFDAVTYDAGSQSVRQLYSFLGADAFYAGLKAYFAAYAYSTCRTEDLWRVLEASSGKPVAHMMRQFVQCAGFPYVSVTRAAPGAPLTLGVARFLAPWARCADAWPDAAGAPAAVADYFRQLHADPRAGGSGVASAAALRQALERAGGVTDGATDAETWNVPLAALVGGGAAGAPPVATPMTLLELHPRGRPATAEEARLALQSAAGAVSAAAAAAGATWVTLNPSHACYYRVVYEGAALEAVLAAAPTLPLQDRVALVDDIGAGVTAGFVHPVRFLQLAWALAADPEYYVTAAVLDHLASLRTAARATCDMELIAALQAFVCAYLAPNVAALGWQPTGPEGVMTPSLRAAVLAAAVTVGDADVVATALRHFDAYCAGDKPAPTLRTLVLCAGTAHGGAAAYDRVAALYAAAATAGDTEETERCLTALGAAGDAAQLLRALQLAVSGGVKTTDVDVVLAAVARNTSVPAAAELAWDAVKAHWPDLMARLGDITFLLPYIVSGTCTRLVGRVAHDDVAAFFAAHAHAGAERAVADALETIRARSWQARVLEAAKAPLLAFVRSVAPAA